MKQAVGGKALDLSGVYGYIQPEMEEVEKRLREELSSGYAVINELVDHMSKFQGKRLRPGLVLFCAKASGEVRDLHYRLAVVAEMIHNATLVHDDVLDEAKLRRRVQSLNHRWGNEMSVLFGDYLFARAFTVCASIEDRRVTQVLAETSQEICLGELLQTYSRYDFGIREADYFHVIQLKTASLFGSCCRLGALCGGSDEATARALAEYGLNIGIAFQVMDDYLDIVGDENEMGKSLGTDLLKGKVTLPIILMLEAMDDAKRREAIEFISSDGLPEKRKDIVAMLNDYNVLDLSVERAARYVERAKIQLRVLKDSIYKDSMEALAEFVVQRTH